MLPVLRAPNHKISGGSWVSSNHNCQLRPGCHFLSVKGPQGAERKLHSHVSISLTSLPSAHRLLRATDLVSHVSPLCPITKHYQCLKVPDNSKGEKGKTQIIKDSIICTQGSWFSPSAGWKPRLANAAQGWVKGTRLHRQKGYASFFHSSQYCHCGSPAQPPGRRL